MEAGTKTKPRQAEAVDRRAALLDAAITVVAEQGLRGLTHRAVEAQAGLPHGSTTYYFGTRKDLVTALMGYIGDRGQKQAEPIARALTLMLADRSKPVDLDLVAQALIDWIDSEAEMELVRYELQIAGARDPEMKEITTQTCDRFRAMCEPIVIACGSSDPARDAKIVQAALDGWLFARITLNNQSDEIIKRGLPALLGAIGTDQSTA